MSEIKRAKEASELWDQAANLRVGDKLEGIAPDYTKAIAEYSKLLELLPNDDDSFTEGRRILTKGDIYLERGYCYEELKQFEKAFADYNKAISLEPKKGIFYHYRSLLYIENGEMEKAKADVEKAVELDPKEAGEYYNRFAKRISNLTEDKRTAAVYYKKSVEHGDYCGFSKKQLDEWGM
jgi:tetratricopeptide (TPR) repeat protein